MLCPSVRTRSCITSNRVVLMCVVCLSRIVLVSQDATAVSTERAPRCRQREQREREQTEKERGGHEYGGVCQHMSARTRESHDRSRDGNGAQSQREPLADKHRCVCACVFVLLCQYASACLCTILRVCVSLHACVWRVQGKGQGTGEA